MSREKQNNTPTYTNLHQPCKSVQVEEMAKCCPYYDNGKCHPTDNETVDCDLMCNMFGFMANLENADYRKQSAVIDEFVKRIKNEFSEGISHPCDYVEIKHIHFCEIIDKLAREMKGGAE